jgi:hypothetical protein
MEAAVEGDDVGTARVSARKFHCVLDGFGTRGDKR